jgi:hypothetical protein
MLRKRATVETVAGTVFFAEVSKRMVNRYEDAVGVAVNRRPRDKADGGEPTR